MHCTKFPLCWNACELLLHNACCILMPFSQGNMIEKKQLGFYRHTNPGPPRNAHISFFSEPWCASLGNANNNTVLTDLTEDRSTDPMSGTSSCSIKLDYRLQTTAARREDCAVLRLIPISKKYSWGRNYEQGRVSLESRKVCSALVWRASHMVFIYDYRELQRKWNPLQN